MSDSITIVAIITMLSQVVKAAAPNLNKQWIPVISVVFGMGLALVVWFASGRTIDVLAVLRQGIEYGLLACGVYSTAKNVTEKEEVSG